MSIETIPAAWEPVLSERVGARPAAQRPPWPEHRARRFRARLAALPGLVTADEVAALGSALAEVAAGRRLVLQAGDRVEPFAECAPGRLIRKTALLDGLARALGRGRPVARVGRFAGQFATPCSHPTEVVDGVELPVHRGDLVNAPQPDEDARRADPARLVAGYHAARAATGFLRERGPWTWTSHEALVLDYELPLVRRDERGAALLTSTHWPWIGDLTRDPGCAHVELLASVANPVACEVGPGAGRDEVLALCERLDPDRTPGRLTLIARLGADRVSALLLPLVAAVRAAGHPVIWLCDPVRGNTAADDRGARFVDAAVREVADFRATVRVAGAVAGGLHLAVAPDDVAGRRWNGSATRSGSRAGPRGPVLDPEQALAVVAAWHDVD
ncbi:3-deoxy-7-phosphoheptulonate synthase [Saccharothrix xinjiangensis]|uniref:Phospho-2-dehydro-3-deoxyheptonate aldolase n=1 Tax=Saccharothrix xinjiangensis TaxID=204798 RepID=A0ABV9Y8R5_9PSEU